MVFPLEKINTEPDTWNAAIEIEMHLPPFLPAKENISSLLSHNKYKSIPFLSCSRAMSTPQLCHKIGWGYVLSGILQRTQHLSIILLLVSLFPNRTQHPRSSVKHRLLKGDKLISQWSGICEINKIFWSQMVSDLVLYVVERKKSFCTFQQLLSINRDNTK